MAYIADEFPDFIIDYDRNEVKILGISLMDVAKDFYEPILEQVDDYIKANPQSVTIVAKLQYFNTSSSKYIMDIFKRFVPLKENNIDVKVLWYFDEDDESMHEAGVDFNAVIKLPFELLPQQIRK